MIHFLILHCKKTTIVEYAIILEIHSFIYLNKRVFVSHSYWFLLCVKIDQHCVFPYLITVFVTIFISRNHVISLHTDQSKSNTREIKTEVISIYLFSYKKFLRWIVIVGLGNRYIFCVRFEVLDNFVCWLNVRWQF